MPAEKFIFDPITRRVLSSKYSACPREESQSKLNDMHCTEWGLRGRRKIIYYTENTLWKV